MPSLDKQRERLLDHLRDCHHVEVPPLATRDPFLLISCMQKALRRGERRYALGAACSLVAVDPIRFWQRLVIIAFEDFGRTDLHLTMQVVAAASSKRWRILAGGEWAVAGYLIERLLLTPRDRVLDDLCTVATAIVTMEYVLPLRNGLRTSVDRMVYETVALSRTCERPVPGRLWRSIVPAASDAALRNMRAEGRISAAELELCQQGRRSSGTLLPIVLPIWLEAARHAGDDRELATNDVLSGTQIGDLPGWCLDGYTRIGRAALHELHRRNPAVQRLTDARLPIRTRVDQLQALLFEIEGGVATEIVAHPLAAELRERTIGCWSGLSGDPLKDGLQLMRATVPELNDIRQDLWLRASLGTNGGDHG